MIKSCFRVMAATVVLLSASLTQAQELKPAIVVSFSGYDALMNDLKYIGELTGQPALAQTTEGMIGFFTQGKGLQGLDRTKPWGAALSVASGGAGPEVNGLVFLPVADVNALLSGLQAFVGNPQPQADGSILISYEGQDIYVKQSGNWAFVAQKSADFSGLPSDPTAWLGGLEKEYDIAVGVIMQNVPDDLKKMGFDQIMAGVEQGLQPNPGETDAAYEARKAMTMRQMEMAKGQLDEVKSFSLGISIDGAQQATFIDINAEVVEGGSMAKEMALLANLTSNFAGFLSPEAAATVHGVSLTSPEQIDQAIASFQEVRKQAMEQLDNDENLDNPEGKAVAKRVAGDLLDVLEATIKTGRIDGGLTITGNGPLVVVAGAHMAETAKLEKLLRDIADMAKSEPNAPTFSFDVEKYNGINFHAIKAVVPDSESNKKQIETALGGPIEIYLGIAADAAYFAMGPGSLSALKTAIDKSSSNASMKVNPSTFSFAATPFMELASKMEPNAAMQMAPAINVLKAGHDRIVAGSTVNGSKSRTRIEIQEGLIKLIGVASQQAMAGAR